MQQTMKIVRKIRISTTVREIIAEEATTDRMPV